MEAKLLNFSDADAIHRIWAATLGFKWPISKSLLANALGLGVKTARTFVMGITEGEALLGVIAVERVSKERAALTLVMVDSACQRKGIGKRLIREVIDSLKPEGVELVSLGAGASKLLWHGVPSSLPAASRFFEAIGFTFDEISYDLIQDISNYIAPESLHKPNEAHDFEIKILTAELTEAMLTFEGKEFPNWQKYFKSAVTNDRHADVIVAVKGREVVGSVLLSIAPNCPGGHWREFLGESVGAFGILGVSPLHRERGIGLALASYATSELKNRGVKTCFLHWTWLRDWYGKLGYKVWEEYKMGSCKI